MFTSCDFVKEHFDPGFCFFEELREPMKDAGRLKEVQIYTDGACKRNPGPGGYGVVLRYNEHEKTLSGGFRLTTNNRMEILAVIAGLEALSSACSVTVTSDSKYVVDAIEKGWARKWRSKNWKKTDGETALNPDLWTRLLDLCDRHQVKFEWVRGHAGHPENERCDEMATAAASRERLPVDEGYESITSNRNAGRSKNSMAEEYK